MLSPIVSSRNCAELSPERPVKSALVNPMKILQSASSVSSCQFRVSSSGNLKLETGNFDLLMLIPGSARRAVIRVGTAVAIGRRRRAAADRAACGRVDQRDARDVLERQQRTI